jgi:hypothetical protein
MLKETVNNHTSLQIACSVSLGRVGNLYLEVIGVRGVLLRAIEASNVAVCVLNCCSAVLDGFAECLFGQYKLRRSRKDSERSSAGSNTERTWHALNATNHHLLLNHISLTLQYLAVALNAVQLGLRHS